MPTVLIADADQDLCNLYHQFFAQHGWRVHTTGTGLDCLLRLGKCVPHLLIIDSQLPWGGADGVLAVIREDSDLAGVPVVVTAAAADGAAVAGLVSPPVVHTLAKPFALSALLDIVRSAPGNGQPDWMAMEPPVSPRLRRGMTGGMLS